MPGRIFDAHLLTHLRHPKPDPYILLLELSLLPQPSIERRALPKMTRIESLSFQKHNCHIQVTDLWVIIEAHTVCQVAPKDKCLLIDRECCYLFIRCLFHQQQRPK